MMKVTPELCYVFYVYLKKKRKKKQQQNPPPENKTI